MQQVSVWLVGPVQPGHSEMLFGCRFAHTGFHFYCLCTHPEHACSHHHSQALEKRVISAYHGSLAPGTSLHPARQAPSLEQPTNQLELASGEPGSAPTQPTKHTLTGRKEEQSEGRIWRWWQEGGTYLDDIESREHAPMGLAVLRNCSDGGRPRPCVRRTPRVASWACSDGGLDGSGGTCARPGAPRPSPHPSPPCRRHLAAEDARC